MLATGVLSSINGNTTLVQVHKYESEYMLRQKTHLPSSGYTGLVATLQSVLLLQLWTSGHDECQVKRWENGKICLYISRYSSCIIPSSTRELKLVNITFVCIFKVTKVELDMRKVYLNALLLFM